MGNISREERFARQWETLVAERIRTLRKERGWSQEELAKRMTAAGYSMHQTTIAKAESGTRPTSVGELAAFAAVIGVPISRLFENRTHTTSAAKEQALLAMKKTIADIGQEIGQVESRRAELQADLAAARDLYASEKLRFDESLARETDDDASPS